MKNLLTPRDVGEILNVMPNVVLRLARQGLSHIRIGTEYRFEENDVEQYVHTKRVEASLK